MSTNNTFVAVFLGSKTNLRMTEVTNLGLRFVV